MSEAIAVALITGGVTLIGAVIANMQSTSKINHRLDKALAVQEERLSELTREVREHNNFARRMPVLEEQIRVANHRIADLERTAGGMKP